MHDHKTLTGAAVQYVTSHNTDMQTQQHMRSAVLTVCFHLYCGDFWVWEGRVFDHAGHAVVVLQVGGEAEDAA